MRKVSIIRPKPLKIKPIRFNFNLDTDKDGFIDHKDCMPFNPKYHRISKTTKKRLKESPLYITDEPIRMKEKGIIPHSYHIMSKEAKIKAPVARKEMLSAVKKYPGVIGEIEREQPQRVVYTSSPGKKAEPLGVYDPEEKTYSVRPYSPEAVEEIPKVLQKKARIHGVAAAAFHESKHLHQDIEGRLPHRISQIPKQYRGREKESPWEEEAQEYMMKKIEEYPYGKFPEKPTGKEISKILKLNKNNNGDEEDDEI